MTTQEEMNKRIIAAARSGDVDTLQDCINRGTEVNCQNYNGETPLHTAAYIGRKGVVDLLLKAGASLSVVNKNGETPLHTAAWRYSTDVAGLLLKAGTSLSVGDNEGDTPLHTAANRGRKEVVDLLLKVGASLSVVNKKGQTPLHTAAWRGSTGIADRLVKAGASLSVGDNEGDTPLHTAAYRGHKEVVDLLIKAGTSPSVVDNEDVTPVHFAACFGHTEVVELLLKRGASPSVVDNRDLTPLQWAAVKGRTEVVDLLLKAGASPSVVNNNGETPLHTAANIGSTETVDLLLKAGASLSVVNKQGETPLHFAARNGSTELVDLLLKAGASLSVVNNEGLTPLHGAAAIGRTDVVDLLLKAGASLFVVDNEGETPLQTATMYGHTEIVDLLLKAGASLSVVNNKGETPLHRAASNGKTVVDILLKRGASLSAVDNQGETPLHRAARNGKTEVVDLLLKRGASPSLVDKQGMTPLYWAAGMDHTEVVDLLLKAGASLSVVDNNGGTPLHRAARWGRTEVLDHLLKAGASLLVVNKKGETPLHRAASNGKREVDILLKRGASLSVVDNQGETPLHIAARNGKTEVVDLLLKRGASPSLVDNQGITPLYWAAGMGHTEVVYLLLKAGASLSVVDNKGRTPLHRAARWGRTEVLDHLLKAGASLLVVNKKGETPLHRAAVYGYTEASYLLLKAGASPSIVNNEGKTPYDVSRGRTKDLLQKYIDTMDMSRNTDEIVAQFPMKGTSDEMKELMSKGTFISYENCIYLGGACNVGKSTLASILIGEEISQHWKSTDGLNIYFGRIGINLKTKEMVPLKQDTIQEDIKEEIRKGTYKIEIAPSDLVDFGGHMSFDMTHQLFMQHKGTFVLMFNGNIDFTDPLKEYEQGETTESILKHWVNSILSYCADDEDILPMIMFSATHSDDFNQKDLKEDRKKKLIHKLENIFKDHKRKHRIIYDDIFFINGRDENDLEINRLKSKLVEVALQQKSWGKPMPMVWVLLDLQLSELRMHNMNIISIEELITLNRRNEDLALTTDEQIKHFLNVQHSLGKILYFDQQGLDYFIIVQPQSLVNILRLFITAELFWPKDKELSSILCTLTETGQIAKQDLLKLWSQEEFHQHMPNDDFKEFIIQVLVHLDILVEPKHYIQEQESKVQSYLVPCIVKRRPPVTDIKSADKMICLSYTLLISSIPAALSFRLIGAAMSVWPLKETSEGICLYHQAAILCIDGSNELHILVEDDKVFVYLINKDTKHFITPNIASTVQECLTLTMTKVLDFYQRSFGKPLSTSEVSEAFEIEVGEWCTSGGGCYISVPELKEKTEWICKNNKKHEKKYPLYWIFDKFQKQVKCDESCSGLDEEVLTSPAKDKHLFRLAERIDTDAIATLFKTLGLSDFDWKQIESLHHYDITVAKFVALCKWKDLENRNLSDLSFQKLSDAFPNNTHDLCQLYKEKVAVYDITNRALQEIPEDDVLLDLSKQVGVCAMHLGVELELRMATIEGILFNYPKSMFKQTYGVMKEWKSSSKGRDMIIVLMKAFQSVDGRGLMFLNNKYGVERIYDDGDENLQES